MFDDWPTTKTDFRPWFPPSNTFVPHYSLQGTLDDIVNGREITEEEFTEKYSYLAPMGGNFDRSSAIDDWIRCSSKTKTSLAY